MTQDLAIFQTYRGAGGRNRSQVGSHRTRTDLVLRPRERSVCRAASGSVAGLISPARGHVPPHQRCCRCRAYRAPEAAAEKPRLELFPIFRMSLNVTSLQFPIERENSFLHSCVLRWGWREVLHCALSLGFESCSNGVISFWLQADGWSTVPGVGGQAGDTWVIKGCQGRVSNPPNTHFGRRIDRDSPASPAVRAA